MKDVIIREAKDWDFGWFRKIHKQGWLFHEKHCKWRYKPKEDYELLEEEYIWLLEKYETFVAVHDNHLVGFILVREKSTEESNLFRERNYMYVSDFVVLEDFRWLWIWQKLMQYVESLSRQRWITEIDLKVRNFNKSAIDFYEKSDYEFYTCNMRKEL